MTQEPIVFIVDDDPSVLRSLARLCVAAEFEVRAYANARNFLDDLTPEAAGCLILDRNLPDVDGHAVQRRLFCEGVNLPVIFLTGKGDIASSVRAIRNGAIDYLTKPVEPETLLETVSRAIAQNRKENEERARSDDISMRLDSLTSREKEVMDAVVEGQMNKQIAYDLDIVEKTVKVHRARMMRKMGARTLAELVAIVVRHREMNKLRRRP